MLQHVDHPIRQENPAKPNEPFVLFQRGGTNWSMRYSMDGRQIRKSLGTSDEREAHRRANEIWHEQNYRLKQGLSILQHAFADVAEEFIKLVEAEAERKERSADHVTYWVPKIRRFLVGYFGVKPIDKITPPDIERYLEWRKTYWTSGPGSEIEKIRCEREDGRVFSRPAPRKIASVSTIKGEMVIIRSLFQQAVRWGYSQPIVIPAPQVRKRADNRRPGFTAEEYEKLLTAAIARISELQPKSKLINARDGRSWAMKIQPKNIMADRIRLWCYIEIMAHSGMRPTEAKNLTWANIVGFKETRNGPIKDKDVRLHVRGKGKHGTSVPLLGVIPALDMLWQLLKATGLEYDYRGVRRTPYSLRHFYISEMLIKGTSIYDVALNTRTSLEMIEKHYAHVATEQIKDRLRPGQSEW